jgi:hypothetical protein
MLPDDDVMHNFHRRLFIASKHDALPLTLETLVQVAEYWMAQGHKKRALQIIALVLCYPMPRHLKNRAEQHLVDLEADLSPRIVQDVKAWTDTVTLDEMVETILSA